VVLKISFAKSLAAKIVICVLNKEFSMKYRAISIDPEIMGGTPVFSGTRVPIQTLFDYIEGGDDLEKLNMIS
jgi:hypothetical protein